MEETNASFSNERPSPLDGFIESPSASHADHRRSTPLRNPSCASTSPLIKIISHDHPFVETSPPPSLKLNSPGEPSIQYPKHDFGQKESLKSNTMVYNEYGELVEEDSLRQNLKTENLNVTQLLRVIKKGYHHDVSFP